MTNTNDLFLLHEELDLLKGRIEILQRQHEEDLMWKQRAERAEAELTAFKDKFRKKKKA